MITFRYLATRYLLSALVALLGIVSVYLIIDFADRAKFYSGPGWVKDVLELYGLKALVEVNQLLPAALALGGAVAMSGLRRHGEITALWALGRGPLTFTVPVAVVSALCGMLLFLGQDSVIAPATYKVDEISALRFHRWGDWGLYHQHQTWFRGDKNRYFYLGQVDGEGFRDVTIFELTPDFRLGRRTDAARIEPLGANRWQLDDVVDRSFGEGSTISESHLPRVVETFTENLSDFRVRSSRPSQVPLWDLPIEIRLRKRLGLPVREWELALYERITYQATGIPAALLGMALALRPGRRGHLTAAMAEGFCVTLGLWATSAISRTMAIAGHLSPMVGGTLPLIAAGIAAVIVIWTLL